MSHSFLIETFGCQMNKSDSEIMEFSLESCGFTMAATLNEADIVIFNTCSVRDHAEQRALARIREAKALVRKRNGIVVVTGCMAQRIGDQMLKEKQVDLAVGPFQAPTLGHIIAEYLSSHEPRAHLSHERKDFVDRLHPGLVANTPSHEWHKWVTITHGCENFCTYCIVPYVRGELISFSSETIIKHVTQLAGRGVMEISLLGQNVNQYGQDTGDIPFHTLLQKVAGITGIEKINFITSHPKDFNPETIDVIRDHKNISTAIHLPLQSGSDRILSLMNRQYTRTHYMRIIELIKKKLPTFSLSTDLIVGFPGETQEDFQATLDTVREVHYDEAYMYAYSPRSGTLAASYDDQVPEAEKKERLATLIELQRELGKEKLVKRIDQTEQIFVESMSKKSDNEVMGKSFLNHPVIIPGTKEDIGKRIPVKIVEVRGSTLYGKRIA